MYKEKTSVILTESMEKDNGIKPESAMETMNMMILDDGKKVYHKEEMAICELGGESKFSQGIRAWTIFTNINFIDKI